VPADTSHAGNLMAWPGCGSGQHAALWATMPPGTEGFIALDWKDGRLVGIEILDAAHHLHDDLLQTAEAI